MATNYKQRLLELLNDAATDEQTTFKHSSGDNVEGKTADGFEFFIYEGWNEKMRLCTYDAVTAEDERIEEIYNSVIIPKLERERQERIKKLEKELKMLKNCEK